MKHAYDRKNISEVNKTSNWNMKKLKKKLKKKIKKIKIRKTIIYLSILSRKRF